MFSKIGYSNCIDICWDITTVCNFNCPYCFNKKEYNKPLLFTKSMVDSTIDLLAAISNPLTIGILGGEPTMHPLLNYIVSRLVSLDNVVKIKIVSNSSKDMSYIMQDPKVHLCLSYHPLANNFYIDNLNLPRVTLYILMVKSQIAKIEEFYSKAKDYKISIVPEYIVTPRDDVLLFNSCIPDPKLYKNRGELLSFKDAYNISFKNRTCMLSHYKITADGSVILECHNYKIGTIYNEGVSKLITIRQSICHNEVCNDDFLMEMLKV